MGLADTVEHHQIKDLAEFSQESFVRKSLTQSRGIVCDFVCFEPGQRRICINIQFKMKYFLWSKAKAPSFLRSVNQFRSRPEVIFTPSGVTHGVETVDGERLILMLIKGPGVTIKDARSFMHGKS